MAEPTLIPAAAKNDPAPMPPALAEAREHIMPVYRPPELVFERGEGAELFTEDGTAYLDFIAGIAVTALGHAHPRLVEALSQQADKLWHTSNMFRVAGGERLSARMAEDTFCDRVFFTNSGTEAVECAIKTARKYHWANGAPERVEILTFTGAFHGRTIGAINAGGNPKYLEGFGPPLPGFTQLEWGDHDALKAAIGPQTAAILVEPVQGEGGVRAMPTECLTGLRALCDAHGILLVYDEVQCGVGRTGKLFAHEWAPDAAPDIMAVAKGVGGGFPLGACLVTEACAQPMQPGSHGSTYGGGPLAMAVGLAVWDEIAAPDFLAGVREVAGHLHAGLHALAAKHGNKVKGVTGKGLLCGLQLTAPPKPVQAMARDRQLLVGVAGGDVLRLAPPLIITKADADRCCAVLDECLAAWEPGAED